MSWFPHACDDWPKRKAKLIILSCVSLDFKTKQTTLDDGTSTVDIVDVLGSIEFAEVKISCHAVPIEAYSGLVCA